MNDREHYISILEKASELSAMPGRPETALRIDRRIFTSAASGAIRAGVPVRVSDDGLFLTIDLGGRSYTVIASAVEAILREDYDRALKVCRFMAEKAYEELKASTEGTSDFAAVPLPGAEKEPSVLKKTAASDSLAEPPRFAVISSESAPSVRTAKRFESRKKQESTVLSLPEDRGEGSVPPELSWEKRRFRPAGEAVLSIEKKVTVRGRGVPEKKKSYLFCAGPRESVPGTPFAAFLLTVKDPGQGSILFRSVCPGELEFAADGTEFRVVGILKDKKFHMGILLSGASADTCTLEINDESDL